jgi:hypothetical protein
MRCQPELRELFLWSSISLRHITVRWVASCSPFTVETMTPLPDPAAAAYELTHRSEFPVPVQVSHRCLRWWASEVGAYAETLQREGARRRARRTAAQQVSKPAELPRRITGTVRVARSRRQPE